VGNLINIINPFILKLFIEWIEEDDPEAWKGLLYFGIFTLIGITKPFFHSHGMKAGHRSLIAINIIFFGLVFKKLENIKLKAI